MNSLSPMAIPDDLIYMNHASFGPMPRSAYQVYRKQIDGIATKGTAGIDLEELVEIWDELRDTFARLIGGSPEGVTLTTNTASALHLVVDGLSHLYSPTNNIVINELEFTTNSYVWQKLAQRYRMELRVAKFDQKFQNWSEVIDHNTIIVSISLVQFSNGYRADLSKLSRICEEHSAYLVVDAIQGLGAVPFDVTKLGVDFVASGGYKWLLGPVGSGYFYLRPELLDELDSILVGWFADKNFHQVSHHPFNPWNDARRYQQSLSPTYYGQLESLKQIISWDVDKTYSHILSLHDTLIDLLEDSKYSLRTVLDPNHRSGIVLFDHPNSKSIVEQLNQEKIVVRFREGGIRISPHRHNTQEQIQILAEKLLSYQDL